MPKVTVTKPEQANLHDAPIGEWRIVFALNGDEDLRRRLAELGFIRGAKVRVVQRVSGGAKVRLNGFNLAMSDTLLQNVQVE